VTSRKFSRVCMSEDKVHTKDMCLCVGTIYELRELLGVSTVGPVVDGCYSRALVNHNRTHSNLSPVSREKSYADQMQSGSAAARLEFLTRTQARILKHPLAQPSRVAFLFYLSLLGMATGNSQQGNSFPFLSQRRKNFPVGIPTNTCGEHFFLIPVPREDKSPTGSPSPFKL
jgi:hypothetical protein